MPQLNARGQAVMGVGASTVSVDGRPLIAPAGAACWLNDETVLCGAQVDGVWRVVMVDAETGAVADLAEGANQLAAGGDRWLGWNPARGVYGSLARPSAGLIGAADGRGATGRDGTLAYTPDRNSGLGVILNAPDGQETVIPQAIVIDAQVLGPSALLWWDGGGPWQAVGTAPPRPALSAGRLRVADVDGERWLVYWSEGTGVIAQVNGAADGYVLETRPMAFNHDAVGVGSALHVAWSVTSGEGPADLVSLIVDRTLPRLPLVTSPEPPIPPEPIPTPEPPDPVPVPEPPYPPIHEAIMENEQGWLIGPGDKAVSIDAAGHVTFTTTDLTDADLLQLTPQANDAHGRCALRPVAHATLALGADATQHTPTGNVCQQFYGKTATDPELGNYELWSLGQWPSGIVTAVIEYIDQGADHGRHWQAAGLTWVKKS